MDEVSRRLEFQFQLCLPDYATLGQLLNLSGGPHFIIHVMRINHAYNPGTDGEN